VRRASLLCLILSLLCPAAPRPRHSWLRQTAPQAASKLWRITRACAGDVPALTNACCPRADVVSIDRTDEHFRLLYNVKGRFAVHRIKSQEAEVRKMACAGWAVYHGKCAAGGGARLKLRGEP
jgi:precorrin-6B methylase 2